MLSKSNVQCVFCSLSSLSVLPLPLSLSISLSLPPLLLYKYPWLRNYRLHSLRTKTPRPLPFLPASSTQLPICVYFVFLFLPSFLIYLFLCTPKTKTNKKFDLLRFWGVFCDLFPVRFVTVQPVQRNKTKQNKTKLTHTETHEHDCVNNHDHDHDHDHSVPRSDHHDDVNCKTILRFPSENLTSRAFQSNMDEILLHIQETEARVHHAPVQSDEPQFYATRGAWRREVDTLLVPASCVGVWEALLLRSDIQGETRHCLHISGA